MPVNLVAPQALMAVRGLRIGAVSLGVREQARDDLTVFELAPGATSAATFTRNAFCAAPVHVAREHLAASSPRYLVINAGNANAGTAQAGMQAARRVCELVAAAGNCRGDEVLPFSTGVVGDLLDTVPFETAVPAAIADLHADAWMKASCAILTTDIVAKGVSRTYSVNGREHVITGIAKGSGMICPDMATMLAFVATDASVAPQLLHRLLGEAVDVILNKMEQETPELYSAGASRKSDFFRDLAGGRFMALAEEAARELKVKFDRLAGLFDKVILEVENLPSATDDFQVHVRAALETLDDPGDELATAVEHSAGTSLESVANVGTGYGRQTLPFPKEQIRSEILCHGLGAHSMFSDTRTVLDIGGQDTKAIQVDGDGIVTSFQMNDRCAAGCGRYLGYIADEMNLGVHELGPLACKASRTVRINSTCTVFAGAELRERLSLGEKREDILAGLHRAIILRAMSLLARSGGIADEFTFTGGVARNEAAVAALTQLVRENYGDVQINISPDSIYTGALGAALFARREWLREDDSNGGSPS